MGKIKTSEKRDKKNKKQIIKNYRTLIYVLCFEKLNRRNIIN